MAFSSSATPSLLPSSPPTLAMDFVTTWSLTHLDVVGLKIHDLIKHEKHRQSHDIKLIASKNFISIIMEVLSSPFTASILHPGINV